MHIRLWLSTFLAYVFYAIFTAHAAGISVSTSVENVSYDLGFMQLSLEKIASNMRVSPTAEGKLLIEDISAARLVITMVEDPPSSESAGGLPERINLPLPIRVKAASIQEVVIINGNDTQTLRDVALNLEADERHLTLELVNASTPWGQVASQISMENRKPFALDGLVRLQQTARQTPTQASSTHSPMLELKLAGNLEQLEFSASSAINQQDGRYTLTATEEAGSGNMANLALQGKLGLADSMPLQLLATLNSSSDDARLHAVHLALNIHGHLSPQPDLRATLQANDSHWRGQPIHLDAAANILGSVMQQITLQATLKNNRIEASGSFGSEVEPLRWQAQLDDLSAFDQSLAGKLKAQGNLSQQDNKPQLTMDWLAEQIRVADTLIASKLFGKAELSTASGSKLDATVNLENASLRGSARFNGNLVLQGTPEQHTLSLNTNGLESNKDQDRLFAKISGRLSEDAWQGSLESLDYRGKKPMRLEQPSALHYDEINGFQLGKMSLLFGSGRLHIDHLQVGKHFSSAGRIASISLQEMPGLILPLPEHMVGNPVFSGMWEIDASEEVNGRALLELQSGDLEIANADGTTRAMGMRRFITRLDIVQNQISLNSEADGTALGELSAGLKTRLSKTANGFAILNDAPLTLEASAAIKTLLWLPMPETLPGAAMDGQLNLTLQGRGTIGEPQLSGSLQGNLLTLSIPSEGVNLQNGRLDASFNQGELFIKQARFQGGDGFLTAQGKLHLSQGKPQLSLNWQADNFTAASRTDRLIVIAGNLETSLANNLLAVSGQVEVIRGLIEMAAEDKPKLDDDIVIVGREAKTESAAFLMNISDLRIGIGNSGSQFVLRGRGLDSTLNGKITLNGQPGQPLRAEGSINAAGTYMAYGQVLNIERGQLNFIGPIDNPGLNILALRQNLAVRAGVEIRGNVLNPTVKLVSVPEVSDGDKLSWLVLGHGIDQAGQDQFAMLSLAAGALLSQGQSVPLQTRFARAAGLDSFNIGGSDAQNTSVSLGKRLASNLYLTYEKEVTGLLNVARLTYDITNRWSVRTQAGSESAVDVLYTFSFK